MNKPVEKPPKPAMGREATKMPFAIEQSNALTMGFFAGLGGLLFLLLTAGERRFWPVVIGLGLGFWLPAIVVVLVPFNVFQGWGGPRGKSGGYPKIADLNIMQRRILVALYSAANRRCAAVALLGMSLLWFLCWRAGLLLFPRRIMSQPLPASQLVAMLFAFSLVTAGWTALFGLTKQIRARWTEIISTGPVWPDNPEFPGPWPEAVRSFFTGRMPEFIGGNSDTRV